MSLLYYIGNRYVAVPLKRDARFAGKSGYNLSKMLALTFARIFSFSMFPIRIVTYMGALLCLGSMIAALALIIYKLVGNVVAGWTSMMVLMLFLFGLNFAFRYRDSDDGAECIVRLSDILGVRDCGV